MDWPTTWPASLTALARAEEVRRAVRLGLEEGKDFELTKLGRERFGYEQGEVLFVPDGRGAVEHIFMGLYAAKRTP